MKNVRYKLRIKGLSTQSGSISIHALRDVLDSLVECAERELRLVVQGESVKPGKLPAWLKDSLSFTISGLQKGSTVLLLDAPVLGETAAERIQQQDFFTRVPSAKDTALSLLSQSVRDVISNKLDSSAFDSGVLEGLLKFKPFLSMYAKEISLETIDRPNENIHLEPRDMEKIETIKKNIPPPMMFIVSGQCDVIKHSTKKFQIALSNGQFLSGILDPEYLKTEAMRDLWGKKVVVKGMVHFSPGGRARLIEAQAIHLAEPGDDVFEKIPTPSAETDLFPPPLRALAEKTPWKEVWGAWPGDESIDDLLSELKTV